MPTVICIETGQHRNRVLATRNTLVEANLHLVPDIAGRIHDGLPPSFDLEDLISEGNLGLIQAATRYRPSAHNRTPFSAFARKRIRGAIMDSIRRRRYTDNTHNPLPLEHERAHPTLAFQTAETIDQAITVERVQRAMTWLTRAQRRVLLNLYTDKMKPRKFVAYKRRKEVQAINPVAVDRLRVEFRRAA